MATTVPDVQHLQDERLRKVAARMCASAFSFATKNNVDVLSNVDFWRTIARAAIKELLGEDAC